MAVNVAVVTRLDGVDEVNRGISSISRSLKTVSDSAISVGKALSIGITTPLVALGTIAVRAAMQQENATKQLEAALKSTGGVAGQTIEQLQSMAEELSKSTTFGSEAIQMMQRRLLIFGSITGDMFEEATKAVLDLAAGMGTDLQTAALQVGRALEAPEVGLTALRRAGIIFTEDQKEMIAALVETGQKLVAQEIVLDKIKTSYGETAKTMRNTLGGALSALHNSFDDFMKTLGEAGLVKALRIITEQLIEFTHTLQRIPKEVVQLGILIAATLAIIGPLFIILGTTIKGVTIVFGALATAGAGLVTGLAAISAVLAASLLPALRAVLIPTLAIAAGALLTMALTGRTLEGTLEEVGVAVKNLGDKIKGSIDFKNLFEGIGLEGISKGILTTIEDISNKAANLLKHPFDVFGQAARTALDDVEIETEEFVEKSKSKLDELGKAAVDASKKGRALALANLEFEISTGKQELEAKLAFLKEELATAKKGNDTETDFAMRQLELRRRIADSQTEIFRRDMELARKAFNNNETLMQVWLENQKARLAELGEEGGAASKEIDRNLENTGLASINAAGIMESSFQTSLSGIFKGTTTWAEGMKGLFSSIADAMLDELARVAAHETFKLALSFITGGMGGGGGGGILGFIGDIFGGFFQHGGSFVAQRPQFIGVGEHGAEQVTVSPLAGGPSSGGSQATLIFSGINVFDGISAVQAGRTINKVLQREARRVV